MEKNLKKSKNKIFGWLFVAYPLATIFLPIIVGIILFALGIEIGDNSGPVGIGMPLKYLGVSSAIIHLLTFSAFVIGIVSPILIFIAGILLLKNKMGGIKLTLIAFSTDFIFRFLFLVVIYSNVNVGKIFMSSVTKNSIFYIFFLIDLCVVYYFARQKENILA